MSARKARGGKVVPPISPKTADGKMPQRTSYVSADETVTRLAVMVRLMARQGRDPSDWTVTALLSEYERLTTVKVHCVRESTGEQLTMSLLELLSDYDDAPAVLS